MTRTTTFIPLLTLALALGACSGDETPDGGVRDGAVPDSGIVSDLTGIEVSPTSVVVEPLAKAQLTVTGSYADGSTQDLTRRAVYDSSDDDVVLVNAFGEITGIVDGSATITVQMGDFDATVPVTVGVQAPGEFVVFADEFTTGVTVEAFGGAVNDIAPDTSDAQAGDASLKIEVPADGYTGAAFAIAAAQNLSRYNALAFWVKASAAHTLDVAGLGNSSGGTTYQAEYKAISVGTSWARIIIPIPDPARLTAEQGLFHFAEGGDEGAYTVWLDDIKFVTRETELTNFRPSIASESVSIGVGQSASVSGQALVVAVDGTDQTIEPAIGYFSLSSSDTTVATVDASGRIAAIAEGSATINATLGSTPAAGQVTVTVGPPPEAFVVFDDQYAAGVTFEGFGDSTNVVGLDNAEFQAGAASLRIEVPSTGFTGGAMRIDTAQDLSAYDALTFWAKSSQDLNLNVAGIGDDAASNTYFAESRAIPLTATWTRFVIPVPDRTKTTAATGLFHFAEGSEDGAYTIWIDEISYTTLGASITNPRPEFATESINRAVGETFGANDVRATFAVDGVDQLMYLGRANLDYTSSNPTVATVDAAGLGTALAVGTADITGALAGTAAVGALTVTVGEATGPAGPAPTPNRPAANVISLFSNAYTDVLVDTWSAPWDQADLADIQIAGDDVKHYTNFTFAGIEATTSPIDATTMTHFHMDVWAPSGTNVRLKLVDFGADASFGGGDDTEHELTFDAASTPAFTTGQWVSLDISLSEFTGMTSQAAVAQYIISSDATQLYIDNVYFHSGGGSTNPTAPSAAAPTPTAAAADVISLFSNAYTNVTVDTWSAPWDMADVADVQIAGDDVKHYTNFTFAGVETGTMPIDATNMTHFHMDVWAPSGTVFRIKLVDFGADAAFGGGDDTEHELTFDAASNPAFATGQWVSFDLPLASFAGMTSRAAVAQYIISGDVPEVYVDNIYFYTGGTTTPTMPTIAAATPTVPAGDVISMFSDAYTDVPVDTWSAVWDSADVADIAISGNLTKHYTNFVVAGVEATTAPIDATNMTHFHMDVWAPDGAVFRIKLVDFGTDAAFGGGDDTEHELTFDAASNPAFATANWISFDIPLTDFVNMTGRAAIAQLVLSGDSTEVYVDNVYFYDSVGTAPTAPTAAAPAPTAAPADVISMFSNVYTDVPVDTWSAVWDNADLADIQIAGDDVKHYSNFVFAGVEMVAMPIDTSSVTHFHVDVWAPIGTELRIKLVDFGADAAFGGGDDTEHELAFNAASTPAFSTGQWIALDMPMSDFVNMTGRGAVAQLVLAGDTADLFVDNVYFYDAGTSAPTGPTSAAAAPTVPAADVISLFSNVYTDVPVDTWSAVWDAADVADIQVAGDDVKHYTNFTFAGVEMVANPVNTSSSSHFHMDIWAPDGTAFNVKLVDFGADAAFGGGDDTEHELVFNAASSPAFTVGQWISLDLPLSSFVNMTGRSAVAQLVLSGDVSEVYVDNVYFYAAPAAPTAPTAAAPAPTAATADVISLFSDVYTDITIDTWSAVWDVADVADVQVGGDNVKLYTNLTFAGVESTTTPIDVSTMTHFHVDIWVPAGTFFRIKLVDFGTDATFGGGDDTEHELTFDAASTPAIATGQWMSLDLPLTDFVNMTGRSAIAQLIFSGDTPTMYVDNVYFRR